jgi:hypothetical protein
MGGGRPHVAAAGYGLELGLAFKRVDETHELCVCLRERNAAAWIVGSGDSLSHLNHGAVLDLDTLRTPLRREGNRRKHLQRKCGVSVARLRFAATGKIK